MNITRDITVWFSYDEEKNELNIKEHYGLNLKAAEAVFIPGFDFDYDDKHSDLEQPRFITHGVIDGFGICRVIWCDKYGKNEKDQDNIHIISAFPPKPRGKK